MLAFRLHSPERNRSSGRMEDLDQHASLVQTACPKGVCLGRQPCQHTVLKWAMVLSQAWLTPAPSLRASCPRRNCARKSHARIANRACGSRRERGRRRIYGNQTRYFGRLGGSTMALKH